MQEKKDEVPSLHWTAHPRQTIKSRYASHTCRTCPNHHWACRFSKIFMPTRPCSATHLGADCCSQVMESLIIPRNFWQLSTDFRLDVVTPTTTKRAVAPVVQSNRPNLMSLPLMSSFLLPAMLCQQNVFPVAVSRSVHQFTRLCSSGWSDESLRPRHFNTEAWYGDQGPINILCAIHLDLRSKPWTIWCPLALGQSSQETWSGQPNGGMTSVLQNYSIVRVSGLLVHRWVNHPSYSEFEYNWDKTKTRIPVWRKQHGDQASWHRDSTWTIHEHPKLWSSVSWLLVKILSGYINSAPIQNSCDYYGLIRKLPPIQQISSWYKATNIRRSIRTKSLECRRSGFCVVRSQHLVSIRSSHVIHLWINISRIMPLVLQGVALHQRAVLRDQQIRRNILMTRLQIRQDPEDRYTRYIQRLLIDDVQLAQKLLPLCSNLTSLALYFSSLVNTEVTIMHPLFAPNALSFPHLRRLYIQWDVFPSEHRSCHNPIFKKLTHLDIDIGSQPCWSGLSELGNLTNLRINMNQIAVQSGVSVMLTRLVLTDFPPSLKYFAVSEFDSRICWITKIGLFNPCPMSDPAGHMFLRPPIVKVVFGNLDDAIGSWIYLSQCYYDSWRRAELEIDSCGKWLWT